MTREETSKLYDLMQEAIAEYVDAEKALTAEFYEAKQAYDVEVEPEPQLTCNVAGEEFAVSELEESLEEAFDTLGHIGAGMGYEPPATLGIHNPEYNVTLMLVGDVEDLDDAEFTTMMLQLGNAFTLIDR